MTALSNADAVGESLAQSAPRVERIIAVIEAGEGAWTVAFEDDIACLVECVGDPACIALSIDLGKPPGHRTAEVHAAVLSYNLLWRETGGARIGLAGDERELVLMREFAASDVDDDMLLPAVTRLADVGGWWAGFVASETTPAATKPPMGPELLLRV